MQRRAPDSITPMQTLMISFFSTYTARQLDPGEGKLSARLDVMCADCVLTTSQLYRGEKKVRKSIPSQLAPRKVKRNTFVGYHGVWCPARHVSQGLFFLRPVAGGDGRFRAGGGGWRNDKINVTVCLDAAFGSVIRFLDTRIKLCRHSL